MSSDDCTSDGSNDHYEMLQRQQQQQRQQRRQSHDDKLVHPQGQQRQLQQDSYCHNTIPQALAKQFVQSFPPSHLTTTSNKRVSVETATAMSEVIRLFVVEAHSRASIEAECDKEGSLENMDAIHQEKTETETEKTTTSSPKVPINEEKYQSTIKSSSWTPIRAEHITKVAANLLMDFS
ncbi:CENP-S associating centromere protein X [Nitzschia inconspicua]|uniref:CENP-S associating centromere protein X n=1 Tax=Nitzschia inconspicua TaxID=303405 RepID=A0A9K3PYL4_9STRA|nr:CENP-S associating centromere protein X [Nitzschia inconspicua]